MNRNGFTLVELLAVIVIIGIVGLIAVPNVVNLTNNSKKETIENTTRLLAKTAEDYYSYNLINSSETNKISLTDDTLDYRGNKPDAGYALFDDAGRAYLKMYYDGYCVVRNYDGTIELDKTSPDNCSIDNMASVTLYLNGGIATYGSEWTKSDKYISTVIGENSTLNNIPTITKTGYKFLGWYTDSNELVDLNKVIDKSIVATAKFEANTYNVTIDLAGGVTSDSYSATRKVKYGEVYGTLPTPTRTGYTFNGYVTSSGTTIKEKTVLTIASDHTIYASWSARTYTITFVYGDGRSNTTKTVTYGSTYGDLPTPERKGYTFLEWRTNNGNNSGLVTSDTKVTITSNQTLYARWDTNKYTITFVYNNGTSNTTKNVTYNSTYGTLPSPTKSGYIFNGWATSSGTIISSTDKVSITSNITLYAQYSGNSYLITFDAKGGTVSTPTKNVVYSSKYGDLPTPKRAGYSFTGWRTGNGNNSALIKSDTTVSIASNHTLYASWNPNKYTITFVSNSSSDKLYSNGEVVYFNPNENAVCTSTDYVNNDEKTLYKGCLKWYAYLDSNEATTVKLMLNDNVKIYSSLTDNTENKDAVINELEPKGWDSSILNSINIISANEIAEIVGNSSFTLGDNITGISSTYNWLFENIRLDGTTSSYDYWGYITSTLYSGNSGEMLYYVFMNNLANVDSGGMDFQITPIGIRPSIVVSKSVLASNTVGTKTVTYDSTYGTLPTPTKDGYSFLGWYTTGGVKIEATTKVTITSNQTLYAQWAAKTTYTVDFTTNSYTSYVYFIYNGTKYVTSKVTVYGGDTIQLWNCGTYSNKVILLYDNSTSTPITPLVTSNSCVYANYTVNRNIAFHTLQGNSRLFIKYN